MAMISRFKSNCNVMLVEPRELDEVISVTEAMRANWRSNGVATDEAMVSGLAPGSDAPTLMVGKSTCGNGETGRSRKAMAPARVNRNGGQAGWWQIGRRTNGSEILTDCVGSYRSS